MIRKKIQLTVIMVILLITTPYGALAQTNEPATAQNETTTVTTAVRESSTPEKTGTKSVQKEESGKELGTQLPLWSVIPFIGILLSIALFPLLAPHFWHHHFGKVSIFWSLLFAFPFLFAFKGEGIHEILHIYLIDYIPFIILLWSLFTVAGGILVRGDFVGKPSTNLIILLIGTFLSSWIGTTGSAMVLIRPLLRANANRKNKTHVVVFFIFLVANIGGSLTPLGDPPLFLGFLHGVPFFYTFQLLPDLGVASLILLSLFYLMDRYFYSREKPEDILVTGTKPFSIAGKRNFIFLVGIIAGVLLSGFWKAGTIHVLGVPVAIQNMARDSILIIMGLLSMKFTPNNWRKENGFSWFPILEVALLFAGIFMTIIPALAILRAGTDGALAFLIRAVQEPYHYFWVTGALSSFLDNAPTYLTFMNSALGNFMRAFRNHRPFTSLSPSIIFI